MSKDLFQSPLGTILITSENNILTSLQFLDTSSDDKTSQFTCTTEKVEQVVEDCKLQLAEYFEGKRKKFDLHISTIGTAFQKKVWLQLTLIPYGKHINYLELSRRVGDAKAIRAVGSTNGKNKFPILVPCHRVIGSDGSLVGYAGQLWRKKWLLEHEAKCSNVAQQLTVFSNHELF